MRTVPLVYSDYRRLICGTSAVVRMHDLQGNPKKWAVCICTEFNGFGALQFELVIQKLEKNVATAVALEDAIWKTLASVTEALISFTHDHNESTIDKTLDNYIITCIKCQALDYCFNFRITIINQLFASAQHLLLLIIGLHVSTDHSVIFRSLICCKFQGAVRTFGIPIVFTLKLNPFVSVGG